VSSETVLRLDGALDRERVADFPLHDAGLRHVETIDLRGIDRIDVAGIALLAELIARIEAVSGRRPRIEGHPAGLDELCRAYRIAPDFSDFP
jgi:phospholipid transport system transporter-binding protein